MDMTITSFLQLGISSQPDAWPQPKMEGAAPSQETVGVGLPPADDTLPSASTPGIDNTNRQGFFAQTGPA
jgi:hypothetical protein